MFFYSETREPFDGSTVSYHKMNAVKGYLRHYDNLMYLQFIVANSDRAGERQQALKEITICEKKLKWWQQHLNYDHAEAMRGVDKIKRNWLNGSAAKAA